MPCGSLLRARSFRLAHRSSFHPHDVVVDHGRRLDAVQSLFVPGYGQARAAPRPFLLHGAGNTVQRSRCEDTGSSRDPLSQITLLQPAPGIGFELSTTPPGSSSWTVEGIWDLCRGFECNSGKHEWATPWLPQPSTGKNCLLRWRQGQHPTVARLLPIAAAVSSG